MPEGWRRSSRCDTASCVEVADDGDQVLVRDARGEASPILAFDRRSWSAFLAGIRAGEFDPA